MDERIHPAMKGGLERYVSDGVPPGGFLRAVLENNLKESFARADEYNRRTLFDIVDYLYNNVPSDCWGNVEKVEAWMRMKQEERERRES